MASAEYEDWRHGLSLRERQRFMFDGKYGCDVTLLVRQGEQQESISAHRFVLICGSSVFEELLSRSRMNGGEPIALEDSVEPSVFRTMVQFLYCEEVQVTTDNALSLLVASKKYHVSQLTEKCAQFLEDHLNIDSVCTILNESLKYKETDLSSKCMDVIHKHIPEVLRSDQFVTLSQEALMKVIQSDHITGLNESEIFTVCLKWADVQCRIHQKEVNGTNLRAMLGKVLYQIRFTSMSTTEFSQHTSFSSLLTPAEKLYIYEYIGTRGASQDAANHECAKFNTNARIPLRHPRMGNPNGEPQGDPVDDLTWEIQGVTEEDQTGQPQGGPEEDLTGQPQGGPEEDLTGQPQGDSKEELKREPPRDPAGKSAISRFTVVNSTSVTGWTCTGQSPDAVDFSCHRATKLEGVGLYGGRTPSTHAVRVELLNDDHVTVADTGDISMTSVGMFEPIRINFPSPVKISANIRYSLRVCIKGHITYYGENGLVRVKDSGTTVEFYKTSLGRNNMTSVKIGQIPMLFLSD